MSEVDLAKQTRECGCACSYHIRNKAADEIERLRKQRQEMIDRFQGVIGVGKDERNFVVLWIESDEENARLRAVIADEIERLRAEMDEAGALVDSMKPEILITAALLFVVGILAGMLISIG